MFLKTQLIRFLSKVDTQLQSKSITPQLSTPRSIATFYLGYQLYIRVIDHEVRKKLTAQKKSQQVFVDLVLDSYKYGWVVENGLLVGGVVAGVYAYYETRSFWWLLGGSLSVGVMSFDWFVMGKVRSSLGRLNGQDLEPRTEKKEMENTHKRFSLLKQWRNLFDVKIALSVLALLVFYVAELKHSAHVDMKLTMKK